MTGPAPGSTLSAPPGIDAAQLRSNKYIQELKGRPIVVKTGGRSLAEPNVIDHFTQDIFMLRDAGLWPIVVHGGGPQITEFLERFDIETTFIGGHRVTTPQILEVTRMVLVGKLNRELVTGINRFGSVAVGVSGEDLGLLEVTPRHPELGLVGDVTSVNTTLIDLLVEAGLVPVIATTGTDADGQAYNVNADLGASAVASALGAEKLIYLTDVDGIMANTSDSSSLVSELSTGGLKQMLDGGALLGGMQPKAEACLEAVDGGVESAHIINGGTAHALLGELLTDEGVGTMITRGKP